MRKLAQSKNQKVSNDPPKKRRIHLVIDDSSDEERPAPRKKVRTDKVQTHLESKTTSTSREISNTQITADSKQEPTQKEKPSSLIRKRVRFSDENSDAPMPISSPLLPRQSLQLSHTSFFPTIVSIPSPPDQSTGSSNLSGRLPQAIESQDENIASIIEE